MTITIWLTGLPAAGKSTLAEGVAARLAQAGRSHRIIDGDELRQQVNVGLGYSREDRRQNVQRAAEICRDLNISGVIAIAALISPYREDRSAARRLIGPATFREIWVAAPLDACEQRDPKGLYRRAREGQIECFTGVSDPYEPPEAPDLILETHRLSVEQCVDQIEYLLNQGDR